MRPLALALAAAAALAAPAAPASASCYDPNLRECRDVLVNWDRLESLCFPPNPYAPYS